MLYVNKFKSLISRILINAGNQERQVAIATTGLPLLEIAAKISATNLYLIIDTGASFSIIPRKYTTGLAIQPNAIKLSSVSGEYIKCYGKCIVEINIPMLRWSFTWTFVSTDTKTCTPWHLFLQTCYMMVDCGKF